MNQVIEVMTNHRSIRSYKDKPVSDELMESIYQGIQAAPTSINGQQLSVIVVKDQEKKDQIAELCGGQPWIAQAPVFLLFAADYHHAKLAAQKNNEPLAITDSLEAIMVSSVDVGLAMGNAIGIAESLGLGIVPIGAVRREPETIINILELPELVFPVAGLVVGYPEDSSAKKPRMPQEVIIHKEVYNKDQLHHIEEYDKTISAYMLERTNGDSDRNWSQTTSGVYKTVYFPKVYPVIKDQGFKNNQ